MANNKKRSTKPKSSPLKDQIKSLNEELKEEKDKFLRLYADFENYRKRTAKERLDLFKSASSEVMTALIPVIDDMNRAYAEFKKSDNDDLIKGFELIYNKLHDTLKSNGLTVIVVNKGDIFDAEKHEAITQIKATQKKMIGKVIDIVETGYSLGDKILRYPKVVVAN
tara:strand:- start:293 stop:793 length:501 start_codon:yes stop_codon:yes gene_type:complete